MTHRLNYRPKGPKMIQKSECITDIAGVAFAFDIRKIRGDTSSATTAH